MMTLGEAEDCAPASAINRLFIKTAAAKPANKRENAPNVLIAFSIV